MRAIKVGNVNVFPFRDMQELMDYTANDKKLLLSLNAEIIMKAEGEVADIINSNIGYADGYGAIKAMCRKGGKELKRIPGCELWLELIKSNIRIFRLWDIVMVLSDKPRKKMPCWMT